MYFYDVFTDPNVKGCSSKNLQERAKNNLSIIRIYEGWFVIGRHTLITLKKGEVLNMYSCADCGSIDLVSTDICKCGSKNTTDSKVKARYIRWKYVYI